METNIGDVFHLNEEFEFEGLNSHTDTMGDFEDK